MVTHKYVPNLKINNFVYEHEYHKTSRLKPDFCPVPPPSSSPYIFFCKNIGGFLSIKVEGGGIQIFDRGVKTIF